MQGGLWGSGHDRWRGLGLFMEEYVQELEHKGQTSTLKSKRSSVSKLASLPEPSAPPREAVQLESHLCSVVTAYCQTGNLPPQNYNRVTVNSLEG